MELVDVVHQALKARDPAVANGFLHHPAVQVISNSTPLDEQQRILTQVLITKLSSHPIPCLDTVGLLQTQNPVQWVGNFETGVADVICNLLLF